jgi:hypothetical protein
MEALRFSSLLIDDTQIIAITGFADEGVIQDCHFHDISIVHSGSILALDGVTFNTFEINTCDFTKILNTQRSGLIYIGDSNGGSLMVTGSYFGEMTLYASYAVYLSGNVLDTATVTNCTFTELALTNGASLVLVSMTDAGSLAITSCAVQDVAINSSAAFEIKEVPPPL